MKKNILTLSLLSVLFLSTKNEPFLLENASNLKPKFLHDNFTRKFNKIFLLKLSYKTHVSNWMRFQGEMVDFFSTKTRR